MYETKISIREIIRRRNVELLSADLKLSTADPIEISGSSV